MKLSWPVEIIGSGAAMPAGKLTNEDFVRRMDTSHEWIVQRTGVVERRIAEPHESTLLFATQAGRAALENAGIAATDLDLIICATITPEHPLPSTSCELQAALGCNWIPAFDMAAACSGFVYGATTAAQYIVSGMARTVLVIGAETMSRIADYQDRSTAILFGDGAGAAVLRRSERPGAGILAARLGADGSRGGLIWVPAGGSHEPASLRTVNERLHCMRMKGREVYKFAVTQMQDLIQLTLEDAGVTAADLALLVPHQSNLRIIESMRERMGLPHDKIALNITKFGNTSAASIPMALDEARRNGKLQSGDAILMLAVGAGLTWGSMIVRL